eukprot:Skav200817  [mRNA]  locus=scaffold454:64248:67266:+ [translate_table: standard]
MRVSSTMRSSSSWRLFPLHLSISAARAFCGSTRNSSCVSSRSSICADVCEMARLSANNVSAQLGTAAALASAKASAMRATLPTSRACFKRTRASSLFRELLC